MATVGFKGLTLDSASEQDPLTTTYIYYHPY